MKFVKFPLKFGMRYGLFCKYSIRLFSVQLCLVTNFTQLIVAVHDVCIYVCVCVCFNSLKEVVRQYKYICIVTGLGNPPSVPECLRSVPMCPSKPQITKGIKLYFFFDYIQMLNFCCCYYGAQCLISLLFYQNMSIEQISDANLVLIVICLTKSV